MADIVETIHERYLLRSSKARAREETEETSGMMLMVAAPIYDYDYNTIGALYGGVLLNRNFEVVDTTKQTVYKGLKYDGKDVGTATIFQDDVRISTNVKNEDGSRAIGTRVSEEVYDNIEIEKDFVGSLPLISIDPSQIQQVFMNMVINAAEAMEGNGRLILGTRFDPLDHCVDVIFTDTGHGIKEEDMQRLLDPFFTTKEVGHGTGLGLAISYGIVRKHRGTITVDSEVDRGTTCIISLSVTAEEKM